MTENTRPLRDFFQSLPSGDPSRLVGADLTTIDVTALLQDGISSISAGAGISINPADTKNPIISVDSTVISGAADGATAVQAADLGSLAYEDTVGVSGIDASGTPDGTTYLRGDGTWSTPSGGGGDVSSVVAGSGLDVDSTDPENPVVSLDNSTLSSLQLADTALQPGEVSISDIDATGTADSTTYLRGDGSWSTPSGGGGGSGTVTNVALSVPTGFGVSGSPITTSGTLAITYASGYQGYTSAEASKLSGIASGATANAGTVTSVALSLPTGLSVSGSPVTASGTFTVTWASGYQGYTTTEAIKLSGIATSATANDTDANLKNRANHTGVQAISTVTNLQTTLDAKAPTSRSIATSTGLTGGGNLTADRTLAVDKADTAGIRARTSNKVLTADNIGPAKAAVSLAYSATRSLVWTDGWLRTCTLTGNMTISNPTSVEAGDTIVLDLIGNNATERSIAWGTNFKGSLPDVTVTSTRRVVVFLFAATSSLIVVSYVVVE